jgi:hypothetical protein
LVVALVDTLNQTPSPIQSPNDVYTALRWRTLVLPEIIVLLLLAIRAGKGAVLVRKPAFADLYITREEWNRYEPAETASIENILAGELKSRVHILVNQTQVTTTVEQTKTQITEQDTTTTDLTQLQQQSTSDISIAAHIDGQVDTQGQYGPVQVTTHIGGSLDYSNHTSLSKATTQSHETVARAVSQVIQSTRQVRTTSTLTRSTDKEIHKFDNTGNKDAPVVGIYRWVDQIQRVELDRYPHRFLLEFEIPEPGAWTRWLHLGDVSRNMINQPPAPFVNDQNYPLQSSDLTADTYQKFVARYTAVGVSPPPGPQYVSVALKRDMPPNEYNTATPDWANQPVYVMDDTSATVPSGYYAANWTASVEGWTWGSDSSQDEFISLAVGSGTYKSVNPQTPGGSIQGNTSGSVTTGPTGTGISVGNVPVTVMTDHIWGFVVNVVIECDPLTETIAGWQNSTYDLLVAAYNAQLQAYNDERASLTLQQTNLVDVNSPDQNMRTIKQELKRQVIEMLTGTRFSGVQNAINWPTNGSSGPTTNLDVAAKAAPEVQFLEQSFEWENLSYICYPYYWGSSDRWKYLAVIEGNDSDFADFLRAGSARVVVPARPGFEDQVNFYTLFGIPWGGGPMPAPGDDGYLSIADEIKAMQQRPTDCTVIDAWEVALPTTLIWLENENQDGQLPVNPSPTIFLTPNIASLSPDTGAVGTDVTITGSNFGPKQASSTVTFSGHAATSTSWNPTRIRTTVPAGATTGDVVVAVDGVSSTPVKFSVT